MTIIPNKGAYVVGISQKDIRDIYEIRSRLEGLCARWACDNITKDQLDELEENIYLSDFHSSKGNSEQVVELDNKFHEILYDASGSKELRHILRDFHHYVQARAQGDARRAGESGQFKRGAPQDCGGAKAA